MDDDVARSFPILKRFTFFVFLPAVIAAAFFLHHMRQSLPEASVQVVAQGKDTVDITRDAWGVPVITGARDEDVYFGMGYAHAQDRMWQMEIQRRIVQGRLSEVFGKDMLQQDAWMRTLGLQRAAQSAWPALSEPAQASLKAYANGVNAWLKEGHPLPVEFMLLRVDPAPWTEIDSLAWSKMFALNLAGNLRTETTKYVALQTLTREQASFFFPGQETAAPIAKDGSTQDVLAGALAQIGLRRQTMEQELLIGGRYVGSNAWVLSGKFTADGGALLANDPHLGLQIPSVWYPVIQRGQRLHAKGMSLVGLPPVIFGQNEHIAWGGTNLMADTQDLFLERLDDKNRNRYLAGEQWETIETRVEHIQIAAEFPAVLRKPIRPVRLEVRSTRNGPIINGVNGGVDQPVSLRWTVLDEGDRSYESFYRLSYAQDWNSFRDLFRDYVAPALNMLYADHAGNIAYLAVGRIPVRNRSDGSLPVPGWDSSYGWKGFIPFDELPVKYNPEKGYIVSANDKPVDDAYPYFISNDWAPPERAERIEGMLRERIEKSGHAGLEDFETMQGDVVSLSARKLLPLLLSVEPKGKVERSALDILRSWDGTMSKESVGASIFNVWTKHLRAQLFSSAVREDWAKGRERAYLKGALQNAPLDVLQSALTDTRGVWCTPDGADGSRRCPEVLAQSLTSAVKELAKLVGSDMDDWKWGRIHRRVYRHQPFSQVKVLSSVFEKEIPSGGGEDTIDVSGYVFRESEGYFGNHGAGFRQIMQLGGKTDAHVFMNSTGQSENVFSQHYSDMLAPFERTEYVSMLWPRK